MPKIKLKVRIKNSEVDNITEVLGIISNNIIKYKEEDNTITTFDLENKRLIRDNDKLRMEYIFNEKEETKGIVLIKELNNNLHVSVKTNKIIRKNNDINIEYIVENDIFEYEIEEIK